ncbi:MAG: SurA N-terminal domain-containing protein [Actinomycetota bacterium]
MTRRFLLALLLVALVAPACSSFAVAAATVNGEKITEAEVERELDTLRAEPIFGETIRRDPDQRGQRRRAILTELIRQEIAEQEAAKLRIAITEEQVTQLLEQASRARGYSDVQELLDEENLTQADARRIAERGVRRFELMDRVLKDVTVDESTVRDVYEGQEERFVEVHLQRITVKTMADAREATEAIGQSSFEEVARSRSTDDLSSEGGDMGFVPLTSLDVSVQSAVETAVEGGLTDPVSTEGGVQIYRLVDRRTRPFEEVAQEIRMALMQEERDNAYMQWLADRSKVAKVVVNPKYGRFDRNAVPPSVVGSTGELAP